MIWLRSLAEAGEVLYTSMCHDYNAQRGCATLGLTLCEANNDLKRFHKAVSLCESAARVATSSGDINVYFQLVLQLAMAKGNARQFAEGIALLDGILNLLAEQQQQHAQQSIGVLHTGDTNNSPSLPRVALGLLLELQSDLYSCQGEYPVALMRLEQSSYAALQQTTTPTGRRRAPALATVRKQAELLAVRGPTNQKSEFSQLRRREDQSE